MFPKYQTSPSPGPHQDPSPSTGTSTGPLMVEVQGPVYIQVPVTMHLEVTIKSASGAEFAPSHDHLQVQVQRDPGVWRALWGKEDVSQSDIARDRTRRVSLPSFTPVTQVSPLIIMSTYVVLLSTI